MKPETLPLYEKVADEIAGMIASGTFRPGERLPSLREVRMRRQVSMTTVQESFRLLEDRGLIEARPQSGFFVRARQPAPPAVSCPCPEPQPVVTNPLMWRYLRYVAASGGETSFACATPAAELYPARALNSLLAQVMRQQPGLLAEYGRSDGLPELCRQIARRTLDWGHALSADDVLITNGCIEALNLCLQAVTQPGDVVAIESPCYFGVLQLLENRGLKGLEIPTDPLTGMSLEALELATRSGDVKAVIVASNFSNPLGALMPEDHKRRLVTMLDARNIPLIEDDVYGDFYFGRERPLPAKAFDRSGNVLYCTSFTKQALPGLRVGWVAGGRYHAQLQMQKFSVSFCTPPLMQAVTAEFLAAGGFDRHMRQLRRTLCRQVRETLEVVQDAFPEGTRLAEPQGGFLLWLELPEGADSRALFDAALEEGIGFTPGQLFSPRDEFSRCLRLSCGFPLTPRREAALRRLGELARLQLEDRGQG
ncbi:PLP-dependent aminotransferase family protein [Crenobacter cavernae]|uniref:Putative 8-amino-7-oxononanoate synthase n=1 Tax=Crenobacter cavernae TaxID=2290923 RepID=A0A345Y244_9NEIS|nr:PLP-dependent aminotransferase family protein [Crenobacter cavernae]AXK37996.1 PLP-dependent aminotransferase family protein [Crenobacter cavernae]